MVNTSISWCCTSALLPPISGWPQVTTSGNRSRVACRRTMHALFNHEGLERSERKHVHRNTPLRDTGT